KESLAYGARAFLVEGERGPRPVARAADLLELAENARFVLVLPLPDSTHEFLAPEVPSGLFLFGPDALLNDRLRGDPRVVGPRHPFGVKPLHPPPADEHILEGVVERVAHVQGPGHIRWRDDDRIRRPPVRLAVAVVLLGPECQAALL